MSKFFIYGILVEGAVEVVIYKQVCLFDRLQ